LPFAGGLIFLTVLTFPHMAPFVASLLLRLPDWVVWPLLAQAPAAPAPTPADATQGPTVLSFLGLPLVLIGLYFILFHGQSKQRKQHEKLLTELQPGDEVVTNGGIFGVITQVKPDRFVVEIAKGTRIEVSRSHIESRIVEPEPEKKA
jgi:preprotein translocase subunit YajC